MRLDAWLQLKDLTRAEFARRIGVKPPTVTRIISGGQNIPLSIQDAIKRETAGAVTPDDLHEVYAEAQRGSA